MGYRFCPDRRAALLSNLAQLNSEDAPGLCLACFQNFLRMLHDFCDAAAGGVPSMNRLIVARRGFEFLDQARSHGRGTLLITGHLGAWELGGMVLAAEGFPINVVTMREPTRNSMFGVRNTGPDSGSKRSP